MDEKQHGLEYSSFSKLLVGLMYSADETADTAADIFSMRAAKKFGIYYNKDEKIQAFVRENIDKLKGSLVFNVKKMVKESFLHGFSGSEIVWELKGGKVWTKKIITFDSMLSNYDRESNIYTFECTDIPVDKMVIWIRETAKITKMNRLQAIKAIFMQFWGRYIESYISPLIVGKANNASEMMKILENLHFKKHIAIGVDENVEAIKADAGGSQEIQTAMEHIDDLIYRVFYIGAVLKDGKSSGGRATSDTQKDILDEMTDWIVEEAREVFLEQWVRKVIEYNFGNDSEIGRFGEDKKEDYDELTKYSAIIDILARNGIINESDYNKIREKFGLYQINKF